MKFKEFGLNETLLEAISYMNFEEATEIQEKAIPLILHEKDLIGCAQTGTGKTAAFILPTLHQIAAEANRQGTKALVLVPTRELAMQIDQQIQGLAYFTDTTSLPVYGGGDGISWEQERKALSQGADIIIATPGRLISHLNNGYVQFDSVSHLILDEADRMLDIGFYDDLIKIISFLPKKRQSLLFSATMAPKIRKLAREILHQPEEISLAVSKPAEGVTQQVYRAFEEQKAAIVKGVLKDKEAYQSIIIFCSTRKKVEQLTRKLRQAKFNAKGISSDYDQDAREITLLDFKSRKIRILVATDVMSRGIDIKDINLVINYDVPGDAEDYVHRIGRTARAATKGMAITLVNEEEMYKFGQIERLIEMELEKLAPPEHLGPGPEWKVPDRKKRHKRKYNGKKKYYSKTKNGRKPGNSGNRNTPKGSAPAPRGNKRNSAPKKKD